MSEKEKKDNDLDIYERQVQICKAFAHPMRLKLLDLISEREIRVVAKENQPQRPLRWQRRINRKGR